jgi:hypothetical protein
MHDSENAQNVQRGTVFYSLIVAIAHYSLVICMVKVLPCVVLRHHTTSFARTYINLQRLRQ